jgi:hypothetical protein
MITCEHMIRYFVIAVLVFAAVLSLRFKIHAATIQFANSLLTNMYIIQSHNTRALIFSFIWSIERLKWLPANAAGLLPGTIAA